MAILIHRLLGGRIVEEWSANSVNLILEDLQQELRERERVEQELQVARRIQQASLPEEVPTLEGWQITPFYQPAREVGGDFYDSTSSLTVGWEWSWVMPQAKAFPQRL